MRTILHVDMDAFYAAVEQRDHPDYRGRPVIVGSDPKQGKGRGIVATCSYEARTFGVHSAQPISQAWRRCPHGVYLIPDMEKYGRVSTLIMTLLRGYTDMLEQVSIDEAFLDVTGSERLFGDGQEIARKIKSAVREELGLTASVGVASNKFVAKVASDLQKPDGLVVVPPGEETRFLAPLPVRRLWGVGPRMETELKKRGLHLIGDIAALPLGALVARLGKSGARLWQLANGIDDRPVQGEEGFKSIGHETTFERDTEDGAVIESTLLALSEKVARRLRANNAAARTITVKYREADFSTYTRRTTLKIPVNTAEKIYSSALELLRTLLRNGVAVRLIGVYASAIEIQACGIQSGLFQTASPRDQNLASAVDRIVERFGEKAITRGTLAHSEISDSGSRESLDTTKNK